MSDEQELPPGFKVSETTTGLYLLIVHGEPQHSLHDTRKGTVAEAWRIYRAIELDVLRDLNAIQFIWENELYEHIARRIAEIERGEP